MNFSLRISSAALAAAVLGTATLVATPLHAASGEEVIKARISFMKDEVERNWRVLAAFAAKGAGTLGDVEASATTLAKLSTKIPAHFPKDTGRGKYPDKMTRTLAAVWEDPDEFNKEAQKLGVESEKLARLAKEGNKDAVVELIGPSGQYSKTKLGCAECHEKFRGPAVKQ